MGSLTRGVAPYQRSLKWQHAKRLLVRKAYRCFTTVYFVQMRTDGTPGALYSWLSHITPH